ncbi:hypothetical protein [Roseivirga pacifica]|uniref:hypothetical protein n=1 Tax=Roseivirga pacifica TaxID=1267423 RepID=UPI003BAD6877
MVTYEHVFSKNYKSWAIHYREFDKQSNEFVIPITLSFGNMKLKDDFLDNKNIKAVDSYAIGFGFDGYEYLGSGFYLNMGVGISPGIESIEDKNEERNSRFLIGGSAKTGLLFVPFPDFGFVIGFNITGRLSNSSALSRSIGFGFESGFNF